MLSKLAADLFDAKRQEEEAKLKRIAIEEQIAALVETGDNGSKTVSAGDGLKVTVKRALSYKADVAAIRDLNITTELLPLTFVPAEYVLNEKAYEELRLNRPEVFKAVSQHVTVTPRKVSVTLKLG